MRVLFTVFLLLLILAQVQFSQTPSTISFQGVLRDGSGLPVTDNGYSVTFKLFDAATGGTQKWTETQTVQVQNGVFTAQLGSTNSFSGVPFDRQYWVQVTVGGLDMAPRIALNAAPYAMSLKGSDNIFPNSGNVGIGTLSPATKLSIAGDASVTGRLFVNDTVKVGILKFPAFTEGIYDNTDKPLLYRGWGAYEGDYLKLMFGHDDTTKNIRITWGKGIQLNGTNVGIGTLNPQAGLDVNGTVSVMKTRETWSGNNQYDNIVKTETAATDCMVYGYSSWWDNQGSITMQGIVNDTVVVSTGRKRMNADDTQSISFPVPKGSTWKVRVNSDMSCSWRIFRMQFGQ
ncbi:MAG: hypothetical protein HYV28_19640 [Ignavibacteriales bacterium]|nr:hypothetical protein [Ignavibacteriales bacterium]